MTTEVRIVGLSSIAIPTHRMRALRPEVVGELATSMTELSQLHPIVLRSNKWDGSFWLVAGRHRYEAAKQLKWACIRAIIIEGLSADQALLAEIDENLVRAELSPAETSMHLASLQAPIPTPCCRGAMTD